MHRSNAGVAILQVTSQICLVDGPDQPGKFGFKCGKVRCLFSLHNTHRWQETLQVRLVHIPV